MTKPNKGHLHEIMDRSHIINSMIDDLLIEHPGMTEEMNAKCVQAQMLLCDIYQEIGMKCYIMESTNNNG